MPKPKIYTTSELRERRRTQNRRNMNRYRRTAQGLPEDAPKYSSLRGERAPMAKLTMKAVLRYRKRWANGAGDSVTKLAKEAGVSKSTMSNALRSITFRDTDKEQA